MTMISSVGSGFSQPVRRLHPLSTFAQLTSHQASGCLRITSRSTLWFIYLEAGKLTFASNSINPFERLDRHLNQLSDRVPALVSAVRAQARLLFDVPFNSQSLIPADYQAIQWLVEQEYLGQTETTELIQELAKEVIESLLKVTEGTQELINQEDIQGFPNLGQLELRPLVEECQNQIRRQQQNRTSIFQPGDVNPLAQPETESEPDQTSNGRSESNHSESNHSESNRNGTNTQSSARANYTIACIDDSATVLQAINSFLDDNNLSVVMINDPLKALIQIMRCKPDLILLDVGMPNLDGYELCSMLRKHSSFKQVPIVMVTGHTGFIDRAKAKLVGASGYLTKPFTRPELMKIVFKYLT